MNKTKSFVLLSIVTVFTLVFAIACTNPVSNMEPPALVTFHANGGEGTMEPLLNSRSAKTYLPRSTFIPPEGKMFSGWAQSTYGEIVYDDKAEFALQGNTELYAVWKPSYGIDNYGELDVFEIYSPAHLVQIAEIAATKDSNGRYSYEFANSNGTNKKTIRLMRDINMASVKDFKGIGANAENTPDYIFAGILDGNNKTIKNLTIQYEGTNPGLAGLITGSIGGLVKDLGIESGKIVNDTGAYVLAGTVFGYGDSVIIQNVYSNADVSTMGPIAGGLVGELKGKSLIENSYNSGSVTVTSDAGIAAAGGLVGSYGIIRGQSNKAEIRNSYNTGTVTNKSSHTDSVAGGIAGAHQAGDINNTYNIGTIAGNAPKKNGIAVYTGDSYPMVRENFVLNTGVAYQNAIQLSTQEFSMKDTFASWNFSSVWEIPTRRFPPINGVSQRPVLRGIGEGK